ncbi:ubiquinol-cytochrome C chaperone family protein [Cucumibacter marinus]|uniref:ubiquinol-cytochrome C chaperone family protein n=1 Tax=Cucumibacter marinus TaxID=1121252 RepID=UPI000419DC4B|nr:ubiquinol-cytochrome C chaperone family protein [Cucumibacter marinus]
MILSLFRKDPLEQPVSAVYKAIVAQSRQERFFRDWGIPDTVQGRFDVLSLHVALVLHRLRDGGEEAKPFSQALFDMFFRDMDRSLRELGVGDLTVPKRIKKMSEMFYGMLGALSEAIASGQVEALKPVLARNLYTDDEPKGVDELASYCARQVGSLRTQQVSNIISGEVRFAAIDGSVADASADEDGGAEGGDA